jgi:hypothetical protein
MQHSWVFAYGVAYYLESAGIATDGFINQIQSYQFFCVSLVKNLYQLFSEQFPDLSAVSACHTALSGDFSLFALCSFIHRD